jgi:hypothetical protein
VCGEPKESAIEFLRGLVTGPAQRGSHAESEGGPRPTFSATSSSVSWKIVRRSEWPRMTQLRPMSLSCASLLGKTRAGVSHLALARARLGTEAGVYARYLSGVGAGGELVSVLGCDRDSLAAEFLEGEDVERGRGDDDLGRLDVDLGVVELVDQLGQGGEVAVHCAHG